jgi:uncharacterized membrane protein
MVIMLLDHVRDYFHIGANTGDPLDLSTTTAALFFTRWITHFCAPIFVFLSGVSAYLQTKKYSRKQLAGFLIKRGLWLIAVEWSLVAFAWTFNPQFNFIPFQVIWAIGISMLILGLFLWMGLKDSLVLAIGALIIATHNLLDRFELAPSFITNFWWDLLHHGNFTMYSFADGHSAILVYPFLPWLGVMMLGFGAGKLFNVSTPQEARKKIFFSISAAALAVFIVLRVFDLYGDPHPWHTKDTWYKTFFSFISVNKYPPSLLFVLMTLGAGFFMLSVFEKKNNWFTRVMTVYGRTAFFFYILHLYAVHALAMCMYFFRGHTMAEAHHIGEKFPFLFVVPGEGFGLMGVYIVWIAIALASGTIILNANIHSTRCFVICKLLI